MKIICGQSDFAFDDFEADLAVVLYGRHSKPEHGSAGAAIVEEVRRRKLAPHIRAWDLLSLALAVTAADWAGQRSSSSDGWTREFELSIGVAEPEFWSTQTRRLQELLSFLTTDRWSLTFLPDSLPLGQTEAPDYPVHNSVALLSGGLDSFIGTSELVAEGRSPFAVSQTVRGDAEIQRRLAALIDEQMTHLQLNHNTAVPGRKFAPSQRARSIIFFAYGILVATTLRAYFDGATVPLFVCENGFIALNPPLTGSRLGSLSTRTCHPVVLSLLQEVMDAASLSVRLQNPYAYVTKGEMLLGASRQDMLKEHAHQTTSCGRFKKYKYKHCGRCVPCLIRRSAFHRWGVEDQTEYVFRNLSLDDDAHARYDDVRAAAMAVAEVEELGIDAWLGPTLSSPLLREISSQLRTVAARGLSELGALLEVFKVR